MRTKSFFTYHAFGELRGNIWMPYTECTKEFNQEFTKDANKPFATQFETLQDIKNHLTNDGDFRSCHIEYGYLEVVLHYGNKTISHFIELSEPNPAFVENY